MIGVCLKYQQYNYGSKLQALATVRMLDILQKDYEIICYNKKTLRFLIKSLPRFLNIVFLNDRYDHIQRTIEYRRHPDILEKIKVRRKAFDAFDCCFEGHISDIYPSYEELKKQCAGKYESVLTCSDQLWSPSALGSGFYNLMFAPQEMKKASWASSFGVSQIPWYQIRRTRKYLNRIQNISMRENRGAEIVKELTGKEVPVLMDPVFVFDNLEWEAMIPLRKAEWENYIFCYFLGDNPAHRKAANELAKKTGKKIVTFRHLDRYVADDESFGDIAPYDVDPDRFLSILRNADYICTDSFHGAAFSAIFEKKFMVFDRYSDASSNSKNSRIESMCKNLGLNERRVSDIENIWQAMMREIDYRDVKQKLAVYRKATQEYLKRVLN